MPQEEAKGKLGQDHLPVIPDNCSATKYIHSAGVARGLASDAVFPM
jgi:hypothetical protein